MNGINKTDDLLTRIKQAGDSILRLDYRNPALAGTDGDLMIISVCLSIQNRYPNEGLHSR